MTEERVPAEVEIKLEASAADDLVHIARLRALGSFRLKPRGVAHLYSLYLDTRNFALARAGVALRLRRSGRNWEATAKWRGRVDGALHQRPELTVALPAERPCPSRCPTVRCARN
jgi:inorganic triphosphatase YgiF